MNPYLAEFLGTFLLVLIGNGVCANVGLRGTKGNGAGWLAVNAGWAMAVFIGVLCTAEHSGGHLNPAISVGVAISEADFSWGMALGYIVAQMAGAMVGAGLVYCFYVQHYRITDDADVKLGTFCTAPEVYGVVPNLLSEVIGTFVLAFSAMMAAGATMARSGSGEVTHTVGLGAIGALPVACIVFAIGLGLGGTTGYAINPARDLGPRLAHWMLPIPGKRDSDWGYAWIPVVGPLLGAVVAAVLFLVVT